MDELTKSVHDESSWFMMFAGNVVLVKENINILEVKFERWRKALKKND